MDCQAEELAEGATHKLCSLPALGRAAEQQFCPRVRKETCEQTMAQSYLGEALEDEPQLTGPSRQTNPAQGWVGICAL